MKKKVLLLATVFGASMTFAQGVSSLKNKKGFEILPEAGDYAIQMDAIPVVDFALNLFNLNNNTGQTAQHPGYVSGFNQTIVGKYFVDANKAYRIRLGINTGSVTNFSYDKYTHTNGEEKEFETKVSMAQTNVTLGGGLEFRRGHNRLQGFYGGEVLIGVSGSTDTYTYGFEYTQANLTDYPGAPVGARPLKDKSGLGFGFGVRGFAGVEYFFAPKIAIGAEFGWGVGFGTSGKTTGEVETWNAVDNKSETTTTNLGKQSVFGFRVDDGHNQLFGGSAALNITFHF